MQCEGLVIKQLVNEGSKSEHNAVCLQTDAKLFKITRKGGNPFVDPQLDNLVGKRISCEATFLKNNLAIVDNIVESLQNG
jgi:hypothetical protein